MDWTIVTKAGLTKADAARLLNVSDVMVWKYFKGSKPVGDKLRRAEMLLLILSKLIDKGALPKVDLAFSKRMDAEVKARRNKMIARIGELLEERLETAPANE